MIFMWARPFGSGFPLYLFWQKKPEKDTATILLANPSSENFFGLLKLQDFPIQILFLVYIFQSEVELLNLPNSN